MYVGNRIVSLIYKLLLLAACFTGLLLNSGILNGHLSVETFYYFTIQSNILVFLMYAVIAVKTAVDMKKSGIKGITMVWPRVKGAVIMAITVTFLVYHFLLSSESTDFFAPSNLLVHYVTPIMVLVDWLIFDKKAVYRWFDPFLWLIIPYVYFVFAVIRAQLGGLIPGKDSRYPYFFIDIDKLGWNVALYMLFLTAFFLVLGYVFYLIDRITYDKGFRFITEKKNKSQ